MRLAGGKARPYLVPLRECVEAGPWMVGDKPLPKYLDDWDPKTNLNLVRTLLIDCDMLRDQCALSGNAVIEAAVVWYSTATRFRVAGSNSEFTLQEDLARVNLEAWVPGDRAGGTLELETVLNLSSPSPPGSALSPSRKGDVLWTDRGSVVLEGSLARFPVSVVDFQELNGIENGAFWFLSGMSGSFDEPYTASLRLLINSRHPDVVSAVEGSLESESSLAIRRQLQFDVARNLINLALESQEFCDRNGDYEEGTLGYGIFRLIDVCFGQDFEALKALRAKNPGSFEATLQSRVMGGVK